MGGDAAKRLKPFGLQQQPSFADKNRAFWTLQSAGCAGYFILRSLSGIANAFGFTFIVHTALLTATCHSITLSMAAAFLRLIKMRPRLTWAVSIALVLRSSAGFRPEERRAGKDGVRLGISM